MIIIMAEIGLVNLLQLQVLLSLVVAYFGVVMVYGGAQLASYILEDITSHICV